MIVQPYLCFEGRAEEAIEFYKKAMGAEVQMLMRFKDSPEPPPPGCSPPGTENKVMHSAVKIGESVVFMSDGRCQGNGTFTGTSMSLTVANAAEADKVFGGLSAGGHVHMPLTKTFFSEKFGMCADPFGVTWMIMVAK